MTPNDTPQVFKTNNINLAAFLYASGLLLSGTERVERETFFSFTDPERARELINDYYTGVAQVDPRDLFARLNDLRDIIHARR